MDLFQHPSPGSPSLSKLVERLIQCQAMLSAGRRELRVFPIDNGTEGVTLSAAEILACREVVRRIGERLSLAVPVITWPAPSAPISLETALSRYINLNIQEWKNISLLSGSSMLDKLLDKSSHPPTVTEDVFQATGLPEISVFSAGRPQDDAYFIIPPCGVPAALFYPWMEEFAKDGYAITNESPYIFGKKSSLAGLTGDVQSEAAFIKAVVAYYGIRRAHFIGICGGAPIALAAAAALPEYAASVFICHGDLYLGADTPRTPFQRQFQALLAEADSGTRRAKEILALLLDPSMLFGVPDQLAPFILYPYADLDIFRRYAKCNYGIMAYDTSNVAQHLSCPVFITTSKNDRMTHPDASILLHSLITGSELHVRESGNHHDALLLNSSMFSAMKTFARRTATWRVQSRL